MTPPFAIDDLRSGNPFEIRADIEVGTGLQGFGGIYTLYLTVRNRTTGQAVASAAAATTIAKVGNVPGAVLTTPYTATVAVPFTGWAAADGDALDILAVLKFVAGGNTDYSQVSSPSFIVLP